MDKDRENPKNLGDRLLEAEGKERGVRSPGHRDQMLMEMIERERQFEERVRRVAKLGWSITFATLPLAGLLSLLIRNGAGSTVEVLRATFVVIGIVGVLSLFCAVLTTIAWLTRSNSPKLAAIERRLATLEDILMARGRDPE